jgi:hypothetical protein
MLSSKKSRNPLACADPPLTVKLTFGEGQNREEVSFGEGKSAFFLTLVGVRFLSQDPCFLAKLQTLTPFSGRKRKAVARLSEFRLAPYLRSEGGLRKGGLSDYPRQRRSPSEAKYEAKKGNFERGSDPFKSAETTLASCFCPLLPQKQAG